MARVEADKYDREYRQLLPRLSDYLDQWAKEKPREIALIEAETGESIDWKTFSRNTRAFAAKLLAMGLKPGDAIATTLPMIKEHLYLIYGCYRIGVLVAPLDLRLGVDEVKQSFRRLKPKAYFFLGKTEVKDFRPMVAEVMASGSTCEHWIQFEREADSILPGAIGILDFARSVRWAYVKSTVTGSLRKAEARVDKHSPALVIFTTGSTGEPKPCVLSHHGILVQMLGLSVSFGMRTDDRMLVNLPPSHVGCMTEHLAIFYRGGTAILLPIFNAAKSLEAIQKYRVTVLGQIPAMFNLQWMLPDYGRYDLRSLRFVLYGGQAVSEAFLKKLSTMAPLYGTGIGLTESAGFITYTEVGADVNAILRSLGHTIPMSPITVRDPMKPDGTAGDLKAPGEIGEICFSGPQVFLYYLGDEAATRKTISHEGICYTGDLGTYDEEGLHLVGRSKMVIKPRGYQVFPTEVENFFADRFRDSVSAVACIGVEHHVFSEGIVMYVEKRQGQDLEKAAILSAAKELTAYKRPSEVILVEAGEMPLNRVAKTDYKALKHRAQEEVEIWRAQGRWDAGAPPELRG